MADAQVAQAIGSASSAVVVAKEGAKVTSRGGMGGYTRITTTAIQWTEVGDTLPGQPIYDSVVPFFPAVPVDTSPTTADGHKIWERTPSRCDLTFYQGDDVIIPLFFNDPALANDDMSGDNWFAQIRVLQRYRSQLVAEFATAATFHTGTTEDDEYTQVELFLPRAVNNFYGTYQWDLYSVSDSDLSRFPKPVDADAADVWPPPDVLRTWLYGVCTIAPRVTSTDVLTGGSQLALPTGDITMLTTGGWCVCRQPVCPGNSGVWR